MSNRNTLWASVLADELIRAGICGVVITPGSRSTPLALAFAQQEADCIRQGCRVFSLLDERSAAFFALGLALADDKPAVLLCTSGSAAANFLPAVVEAHQSRAPLIVLTADRPHELRYSGANQTIDQIKMYGDYALWSVDLALPEATPTAQALRNLRTTAARAVATANGAPKGVVHLNAPFRPPLEPAIVPGDAVEPDVDAHARDDKAPFTHIAPARPASDLAPLTDLLRSATSGVIVCGPRTATHTRQHHAGFVRSLQAFARRLGFPLLADGVSGARFGDENVIGAYDTFLAFVPACEGGCPSDWIGGGDAPKPDVIVRFGDMPTSKWLNQFLDAAKPRRYVHITRDGRWADEHHRLTHVFHAEPEDVIALAHTRDVSRTDNDNDKVAAAFARAEQQTRELICAEMQSAPLFDASAVFDAIELTPEHATLFAGNSLPVRHVDQFGLPSRKWIHACANRGASGIDGNVSTALGVGAIRREHPLVAILGDVTLYHDMNGLLASRRCDVPITLVVLNNNGGGIFHRLPVAALSRKDYDPAFTRYFVTPHDLDFVHAARLYGLDYALADSRIAFRQAFEDSVSRRTSRLIEVRTDARDDLAQRQAIMVAVKNHLKME